MAKNSIRKTTKTHPNGEASAAPPPAYFLSLTVANFRCFGPEQTLDLSDGNGRPATWTVILGDNGVGKTTLLQCLVMLQPRAEDLTKIPSEPKTVFSPFAENEVTNDKRMSWFESQKNPNKMFFSTSLAWGEKLESRASFKLLDEFWFRKIPRDNVRQFIEEITSTTRAMQIQVTPNDSFAANRQVTVEEANLAGLVAFGYGASRRSGSATLSETSDSDPCASLFDDDATLVNAEEWLLQADYAASKESPTQEKARVRRDQIKDVLINLLPDVTDIRISQAKTGFSSFVEVKTPYGWVPIQGLSLGYRTLISWMVDFASRLFDRYPDGENPLAEPAVCLVDEIDLHLHPRWQRTLMSFLSERFPNTQFIATAHSPLVVQAAQNANIVVLRREGDHVVIDNDVKSVANWRVDQVLTSDLFGLESARPPQLDAAMAERQKILSKARLTKADHARLAELEAQIGELPTGETPDDIEAMDIIRRAAKILQNGKDAAP